MICLPSLNQDIVGTGFPDASKASSNGSPSVMLIDLNFDVIVGATNTAEIKYPTF